MDTKIELNPWLKSSLNEKLYGWMSLQHTNCADFELNYYRCSNRVGKMKAQELCRKEHEDIVECISHPKQLKRTLMMRKERQLQDKPYESQPAGYLYPSYYGGFDIFRLLPKRKE